MINDVQEIMINNKHQVREVGSRQVGIATLEMMVIMGLMERLV